ncbi:MAG: ABC transporter ATP-binding protein [Desulfovibrio sp.]|jgi:branched-chain amino acid transport system ATP-binding protein|nr:ABC transporter ATP-binding protein [Desulfovibrio sp.]
MLNVDAIHSYYGKSHILEGVSLTVNEGELVTLLGRNGAGKTTTLRSIVGIVRPQSGSVNFSGREMIGREIYEIAREGISLVPEHRGIFGMLSVEENLAVAARPGQWNFEGIYKFFPRLYERRKNGGNALSGGEQQMLSIARGLLTNPRLLLLDEPTEGLAPVIVDEIVNALVKIKKSGMAVLLVEQNLRICEKLGDRHYVLEEGRIVYSGDSENFRINRSVRDRYLSVGV